MNLCSFILFTFCHFHLDATEVFPIGNCKDEANIAASLVNIAQDPNLTPKTITTGITIKFKAEKSWEAFYPLKHLDDMQDDGSIKFHLIGTNKKSYHDFLPIRGDIKESNPSNSSILQFPLLMAQNTEKPADKFQFLFVYGFFFATAANEHNFYLIGANQVWLGCPQPLCIYGQLDAAVNIENTVYFIRGSYVWSALKPSLTEHAVKFNTVFKSLNLAFVDSAVALGDEVYFTKDRRVYCVKNMKDQCKSWTNNGAGYSGWIPGITSDYIDAAFVNSHDSHLYLFSFKLQGSNQNANMMKIHVVNNVVDRASKLESIGLVDFLSIGVDAAYSNATHVILFQRNINYQIPLKQIQSAANEPTYSFDTVFNCPDHIYTDTFSKSKKIYKEQFNKLVEQPKAKDVIIKALDFMRSSPKGNIPKEEFSILPIVMGAIIVTLIIAVAVIILTEQRRRKRRKRKKERSVRSGIFDRFLGGGSFFRTRSSLGSNILESGYAPGKSKSESAIGERKSELQVEKMKTEPMPQTKMTFKRLPASGKKMSPKIKQFKGSGSLDSMGSTPSVISKQSTDSNKS